MQKEVLVIMHSKEEKNQKKTRYHNAWLVTTLLPATAGSYLFIL